MIGLAVAIAVAAPALAPGVLALLGTTTATALAVTVTTAAISVALSMAAGLAINALSTKPSTQSSAGSPSMIRQSISNARIIYGKRRAGGVIVFFHPRKVGKESYRYFVVAVAGHRCKGVIRFFLNDEAVTVDGSGKVTSGPYANAAWLWFERGEENAAASATFVSECAPKWTAAHRGRGVAKIYAKFQMTTAVVNAGMPNITAEIEGRDEVRDPRTDVEGYTRNAAAIFYDWLAMPREVGGFGAYADELPDDDYLAAQANVCDEAVALAAGGTEARYAFDSVIEVGAAPSEVRQTFVTCCAGSYTFSGGKHLMRVGYWVPVSAHLSEDDLNGPISIPLLADEGQIATEVSGTFIDPGQLYQPQPVPTRSIASANIRQADYDLPHITSAPRGQRILEIMLRRAQLEKRVTWPMNIMGLAVAAMDNVQLATPRYSLSNYSWNVANWGMSSDFSVVLGLRQDDPEVYHWSPEMERAGSAAASLDRADPIDTAAEAIGELNLAITGINLAIADINSRLDAADPPP